MKRSTKYQRICDAIKNDIRSGYYSPGEKLPSERKLSQHYNAAHATINKAVRELVTCGFLSKVDSLGTFVTKLDSSETPISGKYCLLAGDPGKSERQSLFTAFHLLPIISHFNNMFFLRNRASDGYNLQQRSIKLTITDFNCIFIYCILLIIHISV